MLIEERALLEGRIFTFPREHSWWTEGGGWLSAQSWALLCPVCGSQWATLRVAGEPLVWPIAAVCASCPPVPGCGVPGSLLVELAPHVIDTALLSALPPDLLSREFILHLSHYNKENP